VLADKSGRLLERLPRLHKTKGGVKETELNELMVMPTKWVLIALPLASSAANAVITATPVAKRDKAVLKCGVSKSGGKGWAGVGDWVKEIIDPLSVKTFNGDKPLKTASFFACVTSF